MKEDEADPCAYPYCTVCSKWAEVPHLLSHKCRQNRQSDENNGYAQDGPLLAAILKAEQSTLSDSTDTLPQHPDPEPVASGRHATGVCCPKEGCGLRAGSRLSRTHCCRRCEMAHLHGKKRLKRDPGPGPTTGEVWKKSHGSDCTGHIDRDRPPVPSRPHPHQHMTVMPSVPEAESEVPVPPQPPPYPPQYDPMHPRMNSFGEQGGYFSYDSSGGGYANSSYAYAYDSWPYEVSYDYDYEALRIWHTV